MSADLSPINFDPLKPERIAFGRGEETLIPRPFIKWAGGKRRLLEQYAPIFPAPRQYCRYFEPFLGGGAVFFSLRPPQAVLADLNAELINCYQMVKHQPEQLIQRLSNHKISEQYFYKLRELEPMLLPDLERASRFIYLNKTCYNGLYRVNKSGQFNVPFGRYKQPLICDAPAIRLASQTLQNADLRVATFDQTVAEAQSGDFVYLDPPYAPLSPTASFTSYTAENFLLEDQQRLAQLVRQLDQRGCLVMISNSDTEIVRHLYKGFHLFTVKCPRSINSNAFARGAVSELAITNF